MPSRKDFFKGKHVLITGGSEGTGLELARLAALEGGKVTLVARDVDKLETARASIKDSCASQPLAQACSIAICTADVTQLAQVSPPPHPGHCSAQHLDTLPLIVRRWMQLWPAHRSNTVPLMP